METKTDKPNYKIIKPWWLPNFLLNKLKLEEIYTCKRIKLGASDVSNGYMLRAPNGDIKKF